MSEASNRRVDRAAALDARRRPVRALFVTGAYFPEISAGGVQCRDIARALAGRVEVRVLTTTWDARLPQRDVVDGVSVCRIAVDVRRRRSRIVAAIRMVVTLVRLARWCEVVHVQGVSSKNVLVTLIAKLLGRRMILSLQTSGQDEPQAIAGRGRMAWWAFTAADRYLSVSPALMAAYLSAGLPPDRVVHVPNGVDTDRFAPASPDERRALRGRLKLPPDRPIVVFVGYFSRDKQPDILFEAWRTIGSGAVETTLVFVGATRSEYFEVDGQIASDLRAAAERAGLADRVVFTGPTHRVDEYLRAADIFVLPSRREGTPVALLEAMSCGLACVASRLAGSTDVIIEDGTNGLLVPPGNVAALTAAIDALLRDPERAAAFGVEARASVARRFAITMVADAWMEAYQPTKGAA